MVGTEFPHRVSLRFSDKDRESELPFVLGVVAPLHGDGGSATRDTLAGRRFIEVSTGNFDDVMTRLQVCLRIRVPEVISAGIGSLGHIQWSYSAHREGDGCDDDSASLSGRLESGERELEVLLRFGKLRDFEPEGIAWEVEPLRRLGLERLAIRRITDLIVQGLLPKDAVKEGWRQTRQRFASHVRPEDLSWLDFHQCWWTDAVDDSRGGDAVRVTLHEFVGQIDRMVNRQLNEIMHHPAFRRLEAAWRGVWLLCESISGAKSKHVLLKVLPCSWEELEEDLEYYDFDQSWFCRKVHEGLDKQEGKPFGAMLLDFPLRKGPSNGHPHDDLRMLRRIAAVGALSFCPMFLGVHPSVLDSDRFDQVTASTVDTNGKGYEHWRLLRPLVDFRFVGLVMPRIALRAPHNRVIGPLGLVNFVEDTNEEDGGVLWGSAVFAVGCVLIREFARSGWLASIRGFKRGERHVGGLVVDLPKTFATTDREPLVPLPSTDLLITDEMERRLAQEGFISLCHCPGTAYSVFYGFPSFNKPQSYAGAYGTSSSSMEAMLHYTLCASRFAHYIKAIGLRKVGSFKDAAELKQILWDWINQYVTPDRTASMAARARRPLREAEVEVFGRPGKPGAYDCTVRLIPHFELDDLETALTLETVIGGGGRDE
jgi:type VI secretion system protein ImpD